jgi:hypothetical protein
MKRSLNHLWILFLTFQGFLHYGQTKIIRDIQSDILEIDQAYLTISNKNYPDSIKFMFNVVACEHCDFRQLGHAIPTNSSGTWTIDTRYPYDFQLFSVHEKNALQCQVESYRFSEHGSYLFEIMQTDSNQTSCTITQTKESSYYWTPVIVAVLLLCIFVLFIQLCHHIYNRRNASRLLTNTDQRRIVNEEVNVSPSTNRRGPNENHNEDIIGTLVGSVSELPLVGSTRLSNNSIKITKVLPKRLRSLDTFRGFSLMVMIFVNYGGKIII